MGDVELGVDTRAEESPNEDPPDYETLGVVTTDPESEPPPSPYHEAVITVESLANLNQTQQSTPPKESLIVEAPPSYRDIFGVKHKSEVGENREISRGQRSQRPHTVSRRQQRENDQPFHSPAHSATSDGNILTRLLGRCPKVASKALVITIALALLALPLSMVIIGVQNLYICSSRDIPLYLIIGGCCLSVEIFIHTVTVLASMNTHNESTNRSLRMCDCFAFFILIWILIGSNWIFKVSVNSRACSEPEVDYDQLSGNANETDTFPALTTPSSCQDCSDVVYQFAIGVIVVQYIVVFSVFVFCCCAAVKRAAN